MNEISNEARDVKHRVVRRCGIDVEVDALQRWVVELMKRASHHHLHQERRRAGYHGDGQLLGHRVVFVIRLGVAALLGRGSLFDIGLEGVLWGVAPPIPPAEWG